MSRISRSFGRHLPTSIPVIGRKPALVRQNRILPHPSCPFSTEMQMTDSDFLAWATAKGIDADSVAVILECAVTPLDLKTVRTDCLYPPDDICDLYETNGFGVAPQHAGFIFVGYCANGDPIAMDVAADPGSIWYIGHEVMHSTPLRQVAIRVADSLRSAYASIVTNRDFPVDYYTAKQRLGR